MPKRAPEHDLYYVAMGLRPLSREQEVELFRQRRSSGPQERQRIDDILVRANMGFAATEANKWRHRGPFLSLRRAAVRGLYTAVTRFDERLGNKFITYARWWVHQEMNAEIDRRRSLVRTPCAVRQHRIALGRAFGMATDPSSLGELLDGIDCHGRDRVDVLASLFGPVSLDECGPEGDDRSLGDRLAAPEAPEDDGWTATMDDAAAVIDAALGGLDQRLRWIVVRYFGLKGRPPLTLEQIGHELGITRERVRQLRNKAMRALHAAMLAGGTDELRGEVAQHGREMPPERPRRAAGTRSLPEASARTVEAPGAVPVQDAPTDVDTPERN